MPLVVQNSKNFIVLAVVHFNKIKFRVLMEQCWFKLFRSRSDGSTLTSSIFLSDFSIIFCMPRCQLPWLCHIYYPLGMRIVQWKNQEFDALSNTKCTRHGYNSFSATKNWRHVRNIDNFTHIVLTESMLKPILYLCMHAFNHFVQAHSRHFHSLLQYIPWKPLSCYKCSI